MGLCQGFPIIPWGPNQPACLQAQGRGPWEHTRNPSAECSNGLLGHRPVQFLRDSSSASSWWHEKQLNSENSGQGDIPHAARRLGVPKRPWSWRADRRPTPDRLEVGCGIPFLLVPVHREVFLIGGKLEVQPRVPGCDQVVINFLGQQTVWGTPTYMASGANLDPLGESLGGAQTGSSLLDF